MFFTFIAKITLKLNYRKKYNVLRFNTPNQYDITRSDCILYYIVVLSINAPMWNLTSKQASSSLCAAEEKYFLNHLLGEGSN